MNLTSHMTFWRHPMQRELHDSKQRKRFKALLAMRPSEPAGMCSECEGPSQWHGYALSLCLLRPAPPPGSTEEKIAALMPGCGSGVHPVRPTSWSTSGAESSPCRTSTANNGLRCCRRR
jgi:hypothetical protein